MKKTLFAIIPVLLALTLAGCQPANVVPADTTPADTVQTTPAPETALPLPEQLVLAEGGKSEYVILRADRASEYEVNAAIALRERIENNCGVRLRIVNELDAQPSKAIIVGNVNYGGAAELFATLGHGDYQVTVSGDHVIVCGDGADALEEALALLGKEFHSASGSLSLNAALDVHFTSPTSGLSVAIGDKSLDEFRIVIRQTAVAGENEAAKKLQTVLRERFGVELSIVKDNTTATPCEIIIGATKRDTPAGLEAALARSAGVVYVEGSRVYLTGKDTDAAIRAVDAFINRQLALENVKDKALTVSEGSYDVAVSDIEFTVMSFNLLVAKAVEQDRFDAALTQIKQANPDVLGVQECSTFWYDFLCGALSDEYGVVGELNGESQKWRNAIFYRKDRFELVATKTQWLSATPSVSSRLTGENQFRILTYAVLKDIKTGATFAHCNTHMTIIEEVRESQFNVLVKLLDKISYPIVLTGDFNTREGSGYYNKITAAGLQNSYNMTMHNDPAHTVSSGVIDFCFVDTERIGVISHEVLEEAVNGVEPSDHNAVVVMVRLYN